MKQMTSITRVMLKQHSSRPGIYSKSILVLDLLGERSRSGGLSNRDPCYSQRTVWGRPQTSQALSSDLRSADDRTVG